MLALSSIALLVAGSSAAELRGASTETVATTTSVQKVLRLKKEGFSPKGETKQSKLPKFVKQSNDGLPVDSDRGYLLEWTRVNTDCSGRVEYVGGVSSGATHAVQGLSAGNVTYFTQAGVVDGNYYLNAYESAAVDGVPSFELPSSYHGDRCEQDISKAIPFDLTRFNEHQGYYYGHTFLKGDYPVVTNSLKGLYTEYYGTKNECLLGVQPVFFSVQLIKNECYFDSNTLLNNQDVDQQTIVPAEVSHDWYKIHGFGTEDGNTYISYTIHNNDDCEDKDPFNKAQLQKVVTPTVEECSLVDGMWQKFEGNY